MERSYPAENNKVWKPDLDEGDEKKKTWSFSTSVQRRQRGRMRKGKTQSVCVSSPCVFVPWVGGWKRYLRVWAHSCVWAAASGGRLLVCEHRLTTSEPKLEKAQNQKQKKKGHSASSAFHPDTERWQTWWLRIKEQKNQILNILKLLLRAARLRFLEWPKPFLLTCTQTSLQLSYSTFIPLTFFTAQI